MAKRSKYNKNHRHLARKLRKNGTMAEAILWREVLSAKQFHGHHFNRQYPIDNYIVDFICRRLKLVIEVDGYSHRFKQEEDEERDRRLRNLGYKTVRLTETDIRNDLSNVIRVLESHLPEEREQ